MIVIGRVYSAENCRAASVSVALILCTICEKLWARKAEKLWAIRGGVSDPRAVLWSVWTNVPAVRHAFCTGCSLFLCSFRPLVRQGSRLRIESLPYVGDLLAHNVVEF